MSEANVHADIDGYFSASAFAKFDLEAVKGKGNSTAIRHVEGNLRRTGSTRP